MIAWRRATASNLRRNLGRPAVAALVVLAVLIALGVTRLVHGAADVHARVVRGRRRSCRSSGAACARGGRRRASRCRVAFVSLVRRNRRRYGGYCVHIGIITLFVGVAASSSFKNVEDVALSPGQSEEGRRLRVHLRQADRRAARGVQRAAGADRVRRAAERAQGRRQAPSRCGRRRTTSRRRTRRSGPSRASSTASRRPRSAWTRACATTSGPPSPRTSPRCGRGSTRATGSSTRPPTT